MLVPRSLAALARLRARAARVRPPREALIARHAPGASFADVGCMWQVHGGLCFAAEDAGASHVTGLDVMAPSRRFEAEHARRQSRVRFVQGDLHDDRVIAPHDVIWCSGVIYHAPHPVLTLQRLAAITTRTLLLASETVPEVPGLRRATIFAPTRGHHPNAPPRFDPAQGYGAWWWGITPSALRAMTQAAGFSIREEHRAPFHTTLVAVPA